MREDGVADQARTSTVETGGIEDDFARGFQVKRRDRHDETHDPQVELEAPTPHEQGVLYLCGPLVAPPPATPVRRILMILGLGGLLYHAKPLMHLGSWTPVTTMHVVKEKLVVVQNETHEFLRLCGNRFRVGIWRIERRSFLETLRPFFVTPKPLSSFFYGTKQSALGHISLL